MDWSVDLDPDAALRAVDDERVAESINSVVMGPWRNRDGVADAMMPDLGACELLPHLLIGGIRDAQEPAILAALGADCTALGVMHYAGCNALRWV